ncbi:MAG TPA: FCD domain-containing protein [Hyphomicrobiales bacterium]|nr:FCD domain-containing protein [Hyphomicrobiales bacterium]
MADVAQGEDGEARLERGRRLHPARMPGVVSSALRDDILSGRLADGAHLPKEEELRAAFGVGRPAMREAMRILEAEGLVSIVRGNRGGAVVRAPRHLHTAYALALVLKSRGARSRDVADALREIEPVCAVLCARRDDRREVVIALTEIHANSATVLDDPLAATAAFRRFHEAIVSGCGNATLALLVGALEALWSSHVNDASIRSPRPRTRQDRQRSFDDHAAILDRLAAGDAEGTREAVFAHIGRVQGAPTLANVDAPLDVDRLRHELGL